MTIQYREVPETVKAHRVVESVTCDICGVVNTRNMQSPYSKEAAWGGRDATYTQASIYTTIDGEENNAATYHICPTCFRVFLEPWIKEMKAKVQG